MAGLVPAIHTELTVMLDAPLRAIFKRRRFAFDLRSLPAIAATEHALFECGSIGEPSNVTGLAIAKIQRGL